MKFIAKRGTVTPEQFYAIEMYEAELVYTDEEFAASNLLSGTGFVDERTLAYFDPSDPESIATIETAASQVTQELSVEEILAMVNSQESAQTEKPGVLNDDLLEGYQVDSDGLPLLSEKGELIPLSDQKEIPETLNLELEL